MNRRPRPRLAARCLGAFALAALLTATMSLPVAAKPTLALVLGGGSSRGLSHIGLLRAFEEEGIPVDYIVGTSMGSIVAGLYAAGLSADNLEHMVHRIDPGALFAPALPPGGGLIESRRFEIFLDELTEGIGLTDAPIPFSTVVLNLVTGKEETLREGRLSRAILASMSVPGVFPPVRIGDEYYIDGGLRNLAPVSVARETGADLVVAVDVRRTVENIDHDTLTSNLQLTLILLLAQDTDAELERADIVIAPRVDSGSYMDYERMDHFIAEGYRAAKEMAPRIRAALLALDPEMEFHPRRTGLDEVEFADRMAAAVDAYEREVGPPGWSVGFAASVAPAAPLQTEGGLAWPVGRRGGLLPLFGSVSWRRTDDGLHPALGIGGGNCARGCGTVFLRRRGEDRWQPGVLLQGRWTSAFRYDVEAAAGGAGDPGLSWRLRLTGPGFVPMSSGNEWRLTVAQDPVGVFGTGADDVQVVAMWRRYFQGRGTDVLELMRTTAAWYVGLGARFDDDPGFLAEVGVAFEGRLFGLYPLHSRIGLTYGGADAPWSLRWTLGEPLFP